MGISGGSCDVKQKTAYEVRSSDGSSDVCSPDLVGRAVDVGVPAKDVGAGAARTDIAGKQERNAGGAYVGGADRLLRLPHCPDEGRWPLLGQHLCHAPEVLAGYAADAFDLVEIGRAHV